MRSPKAQLVSDVKLCAPTRGCINLTNIGPQRGPCIGALVSSGIKHYQEFASSFRDFLPILLVRLTEVGSDIRTQQDLTVNFALVTSPDDIGKLLKTLATIFQCN